jgi:tetratricopeptide (TPR) repeat protein
MAVSLAHITQLARTAKSARELVESVKETTKDCMGASRSYACHLLSDPATRALVRPVPDAFVSFSWDDSLEDILLVLDTEFADTPEVFIWTAIGSLDLHAEVEFEENAKNIREAIHASHSALAVVTSRSNRRPWCKYEWFLLLKDKVHPTKFVSLPEEEAELVEKMTTGQLQVTEFVGLIYESDLAMQGKHLLNFALNPVPSLQQQSSFSTVSGYKEIQTLMGEDGHVPAVRSWLEGVIERAIHTAKRGTLECLELYIARSALFLAAGDAAAAEKAFTVAQRFVTSRPPISMIRQGMEVSISIFGKDHAHVATLMESYASALSAKGMVPEAKQAYVEAVDSLKRAVLQPQTAKALHKLGLLYEETKDYPEAETAFREAATINKGLYGGGAHPEVAENLNHLAEVLGKMRKPERVEARKEALDVSKQALGERHPKTLTAASRMQSLNI